MSETLSDEQMTPIQKAISVLEWARFGDREHALDCVSEAISLLKPVPPKPQEETGLSDEQVVRQKYPNAYVSRWAFRWSIFTTADAFWKDKIGSGNSELAAWANARASIEATKEQL